MLKDRKVRMIIKCVFGRLIISVFLFFLILTSAPNISLIGQTELPQKVVSPTGNCKSSFNFSGNSINSNISANESHCYQFTVEKEQLLAIKLLQKGIDVTLQLFEGSDLNSNQNADVSKWTPLSVPVDSPDGDYGPEIIEIIPPEKSIILLVVTAKKEAVSNAAYTIEVERKNNATQDDKNFITAQLKWLEGVFNAGENYTNPVALQTAIAQINQAKEEMPPENRLSVWQKQTKQNLLHGTGYIYLDLGGAEQAINYFKQFADLSLLLKDPNNQIKGLTLSGVAAKNIGLNRLAYDYYEEATRVENVSDILARANLLLNFGVVVMGVGQFEKALDIFDKSRIEYEQAEKELGDKFQQDKAYLYHNIARVHMDLGQDALALDFIKKALQFSSPNNKVVYKDAAAYEHLYLGVIYDRQNKQQESDAETRIAQKLWEELTETGINKNSQIINALNNLALSSLEKGEKLKALAYFKEVSKYLDDEVDKSHKAFILINTAKIDVDEKRYKIADDKLKEALSLSEESASIESQVSTLNVMAYSESAQGNLPKAALTLEQAIDKIEFVRTNVASIDLRTTLFANVQHIYLHYIDILMQMDKQMPGKGFAEKALVVSDNMRARGLSEILITAGVDFRKKVNPDLLTKEKNLQTRMAILFSKKQAYAQLPKTDRRIIDLESEISQNIEKLRIVRDEIKKYNPQYAMLTTAEKLTGKQIQSLLPSDTLLIEYSIGPERSYLWLVSDKEIVAYPILSDKKEVSQQNLESLVNEALVKVHELNKNDQQFKTDQAFIKYKEISRRLSQMLLGSVADKIKGKHLIIASDGILQFLPFNALPIPNVNTAINEWQPLIKQNEITMIPSVSALSALKKRQRKNPPQYLAALVSPLYQLEENPASRKNTAQMNDKFSKIENLSLGDTLIKRLIKTAQTAKLEDKVKVWTNYEVSRDSATSPDLSDYRYILYYAHGIFDDSRPESSGLYLSFYDGNKSPKPDKILGLGDIYSMNLNADVVFLSGCETSLGKEIKGEGIVGITRGFMYAGTANVISSLWKVPESQTMLIVDRFFKDSDRGDTRPSEILRKIQIDMWEKDNLTPYYWAAFQVYGLP
jgi:CHAT domain-containing protein